MKKPKINKQLWVKLFRECHVKHDAEWVCYTTKQDVKRFLDMSRRCCIVAVNEKQHFEATVAVYDVYDEIRETQHVSFTYNDLTRACTTVTNVTPKQALGLINGNGTTWYVTSDLFPGRDVYWRDQLKKVRSNDAAVCEAGFSRFEETIKKRFMCSRKEVVDGALLRLERFIVSGLQDAATSEERVNRLVLKYKQLQELQIQSFPSLRLACDYLEGGFRLIETHSQFPPHRSSSRWQRMYDAQRKVATDITVRLAIWKMYKNYITDVNVKYDPATAACI